MYIIHVFYFGKAKFPHKNSRTDKERELIFKDCIAQRFDNQSHLQALKRRKKYIIYKK